jgi:hypothetical protein
VAVTRVGKWLEDLPVLDFSLDRVALVVMAVFVTASR